MNENLNDVQKCILSLLYAAKNEPIKGRLWFQKEMFLISKNFPEINTELDFDSYLYGPHSDVAEDELEQLEKAHLVKIEGRKIVLTDKGKQIAKEIYAKDEKSSSVVERLKEFANDLTSSELLAFIYSTYPEMTMESTKYRNVLRNRKQLSLSLLKKNKISVAKAAEIAGMSIEEFLKEMEK